jgi:class 3 adenylate cyclase
MTGMQNQLKKLTDIWRVISAIGTEGVDYSESRKIELTNQISVFGFFVMLSYDAFYLVYDALGLIGPITTNLVGSVVCILVIYLNHRHKHDLAKFLIYITPNIQIFLLTYFFGTITGMHLLHFMMISFALFIFSHKSRFQLALLFSVPISLFYLERYFLIPEETPIIVSDVVIEFLYISLSATVFGLLIVFFYLFYTAILKTENLLNMEYQRSEDLLLNILPESIAQRLKETDEIIADSFSSVTIMFADIVGFTPLASKLDPEVLVNELNILFQKFDNLIEEHGLEKIKTIGDAYMVAGGLPDPGQDHAHKIAELAIALREAVKGYKIRGFELNLRIGFHTGPVVAGIIGSKKFSYDIWGDAVNLASRLESSGLPGKIQVSEQSYKLLKENYCFEERGEIELKGVGKVRTYFLIGSI